MKATKLIRALAEAVEQHGDIPVFCRDAAGDFDAIDGVQYTVAGACLWIATSDGVHFTGKP